MPWGWRLLRGSTPPIAFALAGCLGLVACGTSKYHYVTTKSPTLVYKIPVGKRTLRRAVEAADSYYKVPRGWKVFSKEQVLAATPGIDKLTPTGVADLVEGQHVTGFDASPRPSPTNLFSATAAPTGREMVLVLDDDQRDSVSLSDMRNFPFSVDAQPATQTDQQTGDPKVEIIARDDEVVRPGGFHGTQVLFNLKGDHGTAYTVNQTTLTDTASRLLYTLVVGCEATCYVRNAKTINEVVASWTIKETK
jgi:hypothetical protein